MKNQSFNILLVEDDPDDVELTQAALQMAKLRIRLQVVANGEEALACLLKEGAYEGSPDPDLILLDLNMPIMDGKEFLRAAKADERLRRIPVLVLTTSSSEEEAAKSYDLGANCFITKPAGLDQFYNVIQTIEDFWLTVVKLPPRSVRAKSLPAPGGD